jgi:hypothetical protein
VGAPDRGEVNLRKALRVRCRRAFELESGAAESIDVGVGLTATNDEDVGRDLARISARGIATLLVFAERDPRTRFRAASLRSRRAAARDRRNFSMRVVEGADHTFTRIDARHRLRRRLLTASDRAIGRRRSGGSPDSLGEHNHRTTVQSAADAGPRRESRTRPSAIPMAICTRMCLPIFELSAWNPKQLEGTCIDFALGGIAA